MRIGHIKLENWKNFRSVDVDLPFRVFLIGPNASGKSNLLDAIRFLRDLASPGGGLQQAVEIRGGVSKIRCLAARRYSNVTVGASITDERSGDWTYSVSFSQDPSKRPILKSEQVLRSGKLILKRPDEADEKDPQRLSQTFLEQINANAAFREVAEFFQTILYQHLVPQIIRKPEIYGAVSPKNDPYGRDFLERLARTPIKTCKSRLNKILYALKAAVPQIARLEPMKDESGIPHLAGYYSNWRPYAAQQSEEQFSDGTIRLIGLLWYLFEGDGPLLLEEPELSLHASIVRQIAQLIYKMQRVRKTRRQVILSTHSADILSDRGIDGRETLLLLPDKEGTKVIPAASIPTIRNLLEQGQSIAEAALPSTEPENANQLTLPFHDRLNSDSAGG